MPPDACHQHLHNSANELRRRHFHCLRYSLNLRDLSLHQHRQIDNNFVDILSLWELGMLGHLVDRAFHCLQYSLNLRDLSLHHHRRIDNNFVDE